MPRVGRFGEGVFVGPSRPPSGLDLDVVYVLGLAEDLYPAAPAPEPLIAEPIRRASAGALRTQRDEVDARHRHLLAAFQAAPRWWPASRAATCAAASRGCPAAG